MLPSIIRFNSSEINAWGILCECAPTKKSLCLLQTNRTLIPHVPEINVKITDVHPF